MGDLQDLIKRTTIEFDPSLSFEELKGDFFKYLAREKGFSLNYNFDSLGRLDYHDREEFVREEYITKIVIDFGNRNLLHHAHFNVELHGKFVTGISLDRAGYSNIEELIALPSGKGQLELVDELRSASKDYFSKRV